MSCWRAASIVTSESPSGVGAPGSRPVLAPAPSNFTSFIPQIGQSPGWSWTMLGCMGHCHCSFCSRCSVAAFFSCASAAPALATFTSFIPQIGQSPG